MKYLLLLVSLLNGCVVASIPIGYAGAVAAHEMGHVAASWDADVNVDFVPRFTDGKFRFAETTAKHEPWSQDREDLFKIAGPLASLTTHIAIREALKNGLVPVGQVPLSWISLGSEISLLYQIGLGLGRVSGSDLGDVEWYYSAALLGALVSYDIWDFWEDSDTKFRVAFGQKKYKPKFGLVATPQVLGVKIDF